MDRRLLVAFFDEEFQIACAELRVDALEEISDMLRRKLHFLGCKDLLRVSVYGEDVCNALTSNAISAFSSKIHLEY